MEKKSFLITEVLALLFGWLGIHRYYTGYIGLGIIQTLTFGGCGIWSFIDFLFISLGKYKDSKGQELEDYDKNIGIGFIIFVVVASVIFSNRNPYSTIINNYSLSTSEKVERSVVFGDITCKYNANSYFCNGILNDKDEAKIKEMQKELRKNS